MALDRKFEDLNFQGDSRILNFLLNNGVDVKLQDQTTRGIVNPLGKTVTGTPYLLAVNTVPNTYTIELVDATGLVVLDRIGLFQDSINPGSYFGQILAINGNVLTMNYPLDIIFDIAVSPVLFELDFEMNKDGSGTALEYAIINQSDIAIDITRVLFTIQTTADVEFNQFGDLAALTRGLLLRKKKANGEYNNIWFAKTNADLQNIMYDIDFFVKANPQNVAGLSGRFTLTRLGIVVRLEKGEELQMVVQDNLTGLVSFRAVVEGHYTDEVN